MRSSVLGRYPSLQQAVAVLWVAGYVRMVKDKPNDAGEFAPDSRTWENTGDVGPHYVRASIGSGGSVVVRAVKKMPAMVHGLRVAA